jgi:thioredoxin reductase
VIRTVNLVIAGGGSAAYAAAANALRHGRHVLVVLRSGDARLRRRFRQSLCNARNAGNGQVTLMTNAEVVCVDGVESVEAVIIRYARTGRLFAVNASAFVSCDGATTSARTERRS